MKSKLESSTSQTIVPYIESCIQKLSILISNPKTLFKLSDELALLLGEETKKKIEQRHTLENRLEETKARKTLVKGLKNKTQLRNLETEILHCGRSLKDKKKELSRSLWEHESVIDNTTKVHRELQKCIEILSETIHEISTIGSYNVLLDYIDYIASTPKDHEKNKKEEALVSEDICRLKKEFDEMKSSQSKKIDEQKNTLSSLEHSKSLLCSGSELIFYREEVLAKNHSSIKVLRQKELALECKIKSLNEKLVKEDQAHEETMKFLGRKVSRLKQEKHDQKQRFDDKIEENDRKLLSTREERKKNLEILVEYRRRREEEIERDNFKIEQTRKEQEHIFKQKKEAKMQYAAANLIQRKFKGFLKRKKSSKKTAKVTKKGKKKGKKGKKGKK